MHPEFEAVIGLEVHCQLATDSKIFCSCQARLPEGVSVADIEPNSNTCPVCTGQPGALPVLNRKVVEYAALAGLATHCTIRPMSIFARKNYFYPDLPKGYQISQYERPICENGWLEVQVPSDSGDSGSVSKKIPIQRIHMEEDAGKNVHFPGYSIVNLNRAGVPLIEIVSGPDMRSPAEAGAYLRALHAVVTYLGICDGNMQEGNFRCDANVSVRLRGAEKFGTRVEIKNVNSFRFVEKAIEYEIARQIEVVRAGGKVVQETRLYDSARNATSSMRSKEEAEDYRYFPDPDLVPVRVDAEWARALGEKMPELPEQRRQRYQNAWGLGVDDAGVLTGSKILADFFEQTVTVLEKSGLEARSMAKPVANLLTGEVTRLANEAGVEVNQGRLAPQHIASVARLSQEKVISSSGAKQAIGIAWKTGESIDAIVEKEGLKQVSDTSALEPAIDQVLAANPGQVAEFKAGKDKLIGFFVGQVMKQTGGKANPALVQELIRKKLSG